MSFSLIITNTFIRFLGRSHKDSPTFRHTGAGRRGTVGAEPRRRSGAKVSSQGQYRIKSISSSHIHIYL